MAKPKNRYAPINPLLPQKNWLDMSKDERELWSGAALLRSFQLNTNPHVLPDSVRALISDEVFDKIDKETITAAMVDARGAFFTIKYLLDHLEECATTWLRYPEGDDERAVPLTTLDAVRQWLENMSAVLGYRGLPDEEGE